MFSFFRRRFYRSATPVNHDEDSSDTEHDADESYPAECSVDDYDSLGLRRVTATGVDERSNDVLLRVARTAAATANVVFFPGDVQDFQSSMLSGSYAEYDAFSYERTAELLAAKFGDAANVWIVRPSRFQFGAFACFDGFVDTNKVGAATSYPSDGSAVAQLVSLMENVRELSGQVEEQACVSTLLPLHLVGFSKGGVVLNQIATELATRWRGALPPRLPLDEEVVNNSHSPEPEDLTLIPSDDNNHVHNNVDADPHEAASPRDAHDASYGGHAALCRQLASMVSSIHWLDSGNGSKPGAVPLAPATLMGLASLRAIQLAVHVTPYQFESAERPWIKKEVLHFVASLKRLGVSVALLKYAEHEAATLASHFEILRDFVLPALPAHGKSNHGTTKTGQPHSPEVPVTPVAIQTRI